MGLKQLFFGWNYTIRKLRKKWDRLREKTLKWKEPERSTALTQLDRIAPSLITLEEKNLSRVDKARLTQEVQEGLAMVKTTLKKEYDEEDV